MTGENSRQEQGRKISIYMAFGNIALFIGYFVIGTIGNSITVISEGVYNLVDACSSLLLLLGFKISAREKDIRHPNGHGRFEYIVGLLISELVLFAAFVLGKESVKKLLHPTPVGTLIPILLAAVIGAGVKIAMAEYMKEKNSELKSPSLDAFRKNELADIKGMILVAVSPILQNFTTLPVDGMAGMVIAVMIAADGISSLMKNISLLLGEGLDKEETEEIMQILKPYGDEIQFKSFEFHDYGPEEKEGIMVLSISPDVSYGNLQQIINNCKEQIKKKLNVHISIYIDYNRKNVTGRTQAVQPYFGAVRQYLRFMSVDMGRRRN